MHTGEPDFTRHVIAPGVSYMRPNPNCATLGVCVDLYERRQLRFATREDCAAALQWWRANPESQLAGMDPAWRINALYPAKACERPKPSGPVG